MMEREQIVKALECCFVNCNCIGCHMFGKKDCLNQAGINAIALIKELTEENERIKAATVRKMQERLHALFSDRAAYTASHCHEAIDRIADEMLEGEK